MQKSIYSDEYGLLVALLREVREQAEISQVELAEQLGTSQSFITKYERGDRRLDIIQLRTICHTLGSSLVDVVREFEKRVAKQ